MFFLSAEKFRRVINSFLNFRDEQETKLKNDSELESGDVTTVNLTMVRGELKKDFDLKNDLNWGEKKVKLWQIHVR